MSPETGKIYRGEEIQLAEERGVELVPVSESFTLQLESGSTEAQKHAFYRLDR